MKDCGESSDFESAVHRAFARLTTEELPRVARERGWPIHRPQDFEQLLLSHVEDVPDGRDCAKPRCLVDLVLAVELGERLLAGKLCCLTMKRRLRSHETVGIDALAVWRRSN